MTDTSEHNASHEVKRDKFSFHSVANFLGWVSAWIFLTGGLTLKGALSSKPVLVELSQWGLFLGPLAYLVILNRPDWRDLSFVKFLYRIWPLVSSPSFTKSLIIFAGLLTYIALFLLFNVPHGL